ncbi:NADP-dependent oxidoreductase [Actinomadura viridis]|uniref:NADPH:quinone reductase-like Zn-dependent oxidoreductase n=1 Tax=Actinomadura viridis TaxID=58110 RepID=A0A931GKL5_9ACTN|nr:NADP-dependent oxidoreductase [Actinomadura viridis]MBG6090482.1 NADPH:quinone reductase-like Zn-dependent oxidoreductase [Actinomadura viridis]
MRAIGQDVLGGVEVLKEIELGRPEPGPTEVLVRVHAAGVNPTDWKHRALGIYLTPPFVLGWDVSGVVEATGVGVTLYKPGDPVFGMLTYPQGAGAYAEYVTASSRHFVRKPDNIDHVQAAALPLAGLTAWQALVDTADLRAGQRVLIHAAAGGVGHLAVQIAKARGAYVIGTASAPKHALLRGLGADELVDYRTADFAETVRDVDVVLDTIGGEYGPRSVRTLCPGGVIVSLTPRDSRVAGTPDVRSEIMLVEPDHAGMKEIAALAASGRLRAELDTVLPLEQAGRAHERGETGRTTGKIVLTVVS